MQFPMFWVDPKHITKAIQMTSTQVKTAQLSFKAGTAIELSFATVIEGKESQLFTEYFPKVIPIVGEFEGTPMGSFKIQASSSKLGSPKMGAFFQWADLSGFDKLHNDPRFLAIKSLRDEALSFFSNGYFFSVEKDTEISFEDGQTYGLIVDLENDTPDHDNNETLVTLTPYQGAAPKPYQPSSIKIIRLDDTSKFDETRPVDMFKFTMNMPV